MKRTALFRACVVIALLLLEAAPALAEGATQTADALVEQLGDAKHHVRKEAAAKLRAMGMEAIAALERAAKSDDPEVAISAAEILKDARFGIDQDWPPALAAEVRNSDRLDRNARVALIQRVSSALKDRAIPFLLCRLASGDKAEANVIYDCLKRDDSEKTASIVTGQIKEAHNPGQARVLGWAFARMNRPIDALRVLTAHNADDSVIREITEKAVKSLLGMLGEKRFKEAADTAVEFAKAAPSEARLLYLHAAALQGLGNDKNATTLQEKALGLNPGEEGSHYTAADMLMTMGHDDISRREWELILKIPPADDVYDINAYLRLSQISEKTGKYEASADYLEKALNVYKSKRAGGGTGYGMIGATEDELAKKVAALRGKGRRGTFVAGNRGEQVRLRIQAVVKDGRLAELRKALSSANCSMTIGVEPLGMRLFDLEQTTVAYNREKETLSVLLAGAACSEPQGFAGANSEPKLVIAIHNLDCIHTFEVDTMSGAVRKSERFEKDYTVKAEVDDSIKDYRTAPVKIGDREYSWDDLLKGATLDYLPPVMELRLEGKQPDGTQEALEISIPIEEGALDLVEENKKEEPGTR